MPIEKQTYSGANGAAANVANTGFTAVTITDGGTLVFDTSVTFRGVQSLLGTGTTTSGALYGRRDFTATDAFSIDFPYQATVLPSSELQFFFLGAGETRAVAVTVDASGTVRVRNAANTVVWTSTGAMVAGTGYIVKVAVGRNASTGTIRVQLVALDETTILRDSGNLTAQNTGTTAVSRFRIGPKGGTSVAPAAGRFGEPRFDTSSTTVLPAPVAHQPFRRWTGSGYVIPTVTGWHAGQYINLP